VQNVQHLAVDVEAGIMDALDRAILRRLQQDGRQTNRDLAEAVGIAPSTALERTRALRARGVITGVHAAVDPVALGRSVQALVGVRIRPQSRETRPACSRRRISPRCRAPEPRWPRRGDSSASRRRFA